MSFYERFYPKAYAESTYSIPFQMLYDKGYRGIIFDIDNTLVPHGAPADQRAKDFFDELRQIGFRTCLISNNHEDRVSPFAFSVRSDAVWDAKKPSVKNYLKACEKMKTSKKQTLFVGDQIFTDVWGANRAGIDSILVKQIHKKEEIQIVLKRKLEKIVLEKYMERTDKSEDLF